MHETELIKRPQLDYQVHSLIASRWSPRAYDSKPVEPWKLQQIFEAGRWAASANNLQPWYFLVGYNGDEVFSKIFTTLAEFNRLWVANAPVLALAVAKTTNSRDELNKSYAYDLGQAVATLSLQAAEDGVHAHQMGGFDSEAAALSLNIPPDYKVLVAFTLGYLGDAENLHPNLTKLELTPRSRRPVSETVFTGSFGHKADFLK